MTGIRWDEGRDRVLVDLADAYNFDPDEVDELVRWLNDTLVDAVAVPPALAITALMKLVVEEAQKTAAPEEMLDTAVALIDVFKP
jgi:hypothetical protein